MLDYSLMLWLSREFPRCELAIMASGIGTGIRAPADIGRGIEIEDV
jgi:hypothetical protein